MLEFIITELTKAAEEGTEEALIKAKDRIKSGIRSEKNAINSKDIYDALTTLIKDPKISSSARRQFISAQKQYEKRAAKEDVAKQVAMSPKAQNFVPGAAAAEAQQKQEEQQGKVEGWLDQNDPKEIKELGHAKQYKQDTENPKMRSKSVDKITSGVRNRLATGEGLTVRDKQYGANLDAQAKLKAAEQKLVQQKGPASVIRVPGEQPQIPPQHANDPKIKAMMNLRNSVADPEHHKLIDKEIHTHIASLSNPLGKSADFELGHTPNGQWHIKAF